MPLAFIVIVCGLPFVAAWVVYLNPGLLPAGRSNAGHLVSPPRRLDATGLRTRSGRDFELDTGTDLWTLAWIGPLRCDDACGRQLAMMQNMRHALRESGDRLRLLAIVPEGGERQGWDRQSAAAPEAVVLDAAGGAADRLAGQFGADRPGAAGGVTMALLDPRGNLALTYLDADDPRGVLKDLQRVLQFSRVGQIVVPAAVPAAR